MAEAAQELTLQSVLDQLKVANELQQLLADITEECLIVKPPREFKDKDDLYDAKEKNYFKSPEEFINYCVNILIKKELVLNLLEHQM